jgi:hypothetical protein
VRERSIKQPPVHGHLGTAEQPVDAFDAVFRSRLPRQTSPDRRRDQPTSFDNSLDQLDHRSKPAVVNFIATP